MTEGSQPPHPTQLLWRIGFSDLPAGAAVTLVAFLQYVFLAKLWEGYPFRWRDDLIHNNVVYAGVILTIVGSSLIVWWSLRTWSLGAMAARRLERPASHPSFAAIVSALATIASRSTLGVTPDLYYTPKDALALEVREHSRPGVIVVGLEQRHRQRDAPELFNAQLGHEVSHLELAGTRTEVLTRRIIAVHFRVLGWSTLVFVLVIAFIDRTGIGGAPVQRSPKLVADQPPPSFVTKA